MSTEVVQGREALPAEIEADRRRTKVAKHPRFQQIEALLSRGKSAFWIAAWLEECYPVEDEAGDPPEGLTAADVERNRRLRVSELSLEDYRERFMPEALPGVDVVLDEIDDIVGRRFPGSERGPQFELELLDMAIDVGQHMLAQGLSGDEKLGMGVSETTLNAHAGFVDTVRTSVEIKQKLGVDGYEPLPEHHIIDQTTRQLNVHLHGKVDPRTGRLGPGEPGKVEALRELLQADPSQAKALLEAAVKEETGDAGSEQPGRPDS